MWHCENSNHLYDQSMVQLLLTQNREAGLANFGTKGLHNIPWARFVTVGARCYFSKHLAPTVTKRYWIRRNGFDGPELFPSGTIPQLEAQAPEGIGLEFCILNCPGCRIPI
eukprot:COSAG02_NODE_23_length_52893_cov_58.101868_56_plen_111_part_00